MRALPASRDVLRIAASRGNASGNASDSPSPASGVVRVRNLAARVLRHVPLPPELVAAIGAALDREAGELDPATRAATLAKTRGALEGWLEGTATTDQAARALRGAGDGA
jgi:hypothetical protein